jgi:hypothetical protein
MYGWVHSKYSKIIKQPLNIKTAQSNFLIKTDNEKVSSKIKQLTTSKPLDGSKNIINLLRKRIRDITIDKSEAIKSRNQAREILEKKILSASIEINNLKTSSASLSKELEKTKSEKSAALLAAKQDATKAQADILASNKRFDDLSVNSSKEISSLKTTSASLEKTLERVKSEKSAALLAAKQGATKAHGDILASNKRFDDLSVNSSKEISSLKSTTISLKKSLERVISEKSAAILASKQAATKTQAVIIAHSKAFEELTAKNSQEIKIFKTNNASMRKELEKANSLEPINKRLRLELEQIKDDSKKIQKELKTIKLNGRSDTIIPPSTKTKEQELSVFNNWNNRRTVTSQLNEWVKAWEIQNTNLYLSFYSKNFKDPKRSRSKWEAKRRLSLKNASNVSIEISDIRSSALDNVITMIFTQRYKAKNIFDLGEKELIWKKEGQNWKIIKETWRPSFLLD